LRFDFRMKYLPTGAFFGETRTVTEAGHLLVTQVDYPSGAPGAGWHYHEHAFFSLVLDGHMSDDTKESSVECPQGTLLFLPSQEPHRNGHSGARLNTLFVEVTDAWFQANGLREETLRRVRHIRDPRIRILVRQLHRETIGRLPHAELVVDGLLTRIVASLAGDASSSRANNTLTRRIKELLHTSTDTLTLIGVARELNVHPVYLSRYFARHFGCGFREYLRLARMERSLTLMHDATLSLTDIAFAAGFADQSHFARCFRNAFGETPSEYRRVIG
jgi:AraC-like DNA-binding protein/quercetin dioxygenase-like cupin family protein